MFPAFLKDVVSIHLGGIAHRKDEGIDSFIESLWSWTRSPIPAPFLPWYVESKEAPKLMAEANKIRTFFRILFASCILTLGADGLTDAKRINMNHIASDVLQQVAFGGYFLANIVSINVSLMQMTSLTLEMRRC